jgi:hypothetical protein
MLELTFVGSVDAIAFAVALEPAGEAVTVLNALEAQGRT